MISKKKTIKYGILILFIACAVSFTACSQKTEKEELKKEIKQELKEEIKEETVSANMAAEEPVVHDRLFYKKLLRRLINDEIYIVIPLHNEPDYYSKAVKYLGADHSPYEMWRVEEDDYLDFENLEYYICDVDGDGIDEIGIQFIPCEQYMYEYDEERDVLHQKRARCVRGEILGNGQILYTYDEEGYVLKIYNSFEKCLQSVSYYITSKEGSGGYDPEGNDDPIYCIDGADVTEEQWQKLFVEPIKELRRNAPQPFSYEELMRD